MRTNGAQGIAVRGPVPITKSSQSRGATAHIAARSARNVRGGLIRPGSFPPRRFAFRQHGLRPIDAPIRLPHQRLRKAFDLPPRRRLFAPCGFPLRLWGGVDYGRLVATEPDPPHPTGKALRAMGRASVEAVTACFTRCGAPVRKAIPIRVDSELPGMTRWTRWGTRLGER
jgi:hypothetical protein